MIELIDAIELVLALARQNILDARECDNNDEMLAERERQIEACNTLENFAVNRLGDD